MSDFTIALKIKSRTYETFALLCTEYVVFDEADRLFEMGFGEQLNEVIFPKNSL